MQNTMKKSSIIKKIFRTALIPAVIFTAFSATYGTAQAAETADAYPPVAQVQAQLEQAGGTVFPIGKPNTAYEAFFTGRTFLAPLAYDSINVANVTFTRGAHTYWHIHRGSCQILVPESGRGYYQIWGEEPQQLVPGVVATIPEGVKHWHGAGPNSVMQHLSIMQVGPDVTTEWLEPVDDAVFAALK